MTELGHVVLYVRELQPMVDFYQRGVGLQLVGKLFDGRAAMLSGGRTHHELLLIEVGQAQGPLTGQRIGLYHIGWKVGNSLDELRSIYHRLKELDHDIDGLSDHTVSQSLYLRDPDGNELELYVDNPDFDWRADSSWMDAPVKPLSLD